MHNLNEDKIKCEQWTWIAACFNDMESCFHINHELEEHLVDHISQ